MDKNVAVVGGGGRIGISLLYELVRLGISVPVVVERQGLTIDSLVERANQEDLSRGRLPWIVAKQGNDILDVKLTGLEGELNYRPSRIQFITPNNPSEIDWMKLGIYLVEECTGNCTNKSSEGLSLPKYGADVHFGNGARIVMVSAPTVGEDATLIYGINENRYEPGKHFFISNGSCTTKAVAFPLAVLLDSGVKLFGNVVVNSVHAETGPELAELKSPEHQPSYGKIKENPSGAYTSLASVFNTDGIVIEGCEAYAHRIPTLNGSVAIINVDTGRNYTSEEINDMFRKAKKDEKYKGGIAVYEGKEPMHSGLITSKNGRVPIFGSNIPSSVISPIRTYVMGRTSAQFASWYNNEDAPPHNQANLTKYILEG